MDELDDSEIEETLSMVSRLRSVRLSDGHGGDPDATSIAGSTLLSGERFRILRAHTQGRLGQVFIAEDTELHREVALKEI